MKRLLSVLLISLTLIAGGAPDVLAQVTRNADSKATQATGTARNATQVPAAPRKSNTQAATPVARTTDFFNQYFYDKALRVDYVHAGNDTSDFYAIDELISEPFYAGSKTNTVSPFDFGNYRAVLTDAATGTVIWQQGYSSLFSEWQTTAEARTVRRAMTENVVFPFPKKPSVLTFYNRSKQMEWSEKFTLPINPTDMFIKHDRRHVYPHFTVKQSGDPATSLDIVFIPEGYTAAEMDKFKADCERFAGNLLSCEPYTKYADRINIYGVEAPSMHSGSDVPGDGIWKNTVLNSGFYTFGIDRYLTTPDMKSVRDVAANAPYDQICIVVNSPVYGGGGIYNFYALFTSDNAYADYVFVHEFGHSFGGLGDEYYESEVAYEDMYDLRFEPWEPNLTTLVDFDSKWKNMTDAGAPVPTPETMKSTVKVGAYEGGGYLNKGIYRPSHDCSMKSGTFNNFCPVCKDALSRMIESYLQ